MALLFWGVRLLMAAVGLGVVYVAAFTYESTDKRIQNWLEDLWLRLSYDSRTPVGVAKGLGRVVLVLLDKFFDRLFASRHLSIRTLSVALCYAFGALFLTAVPLSLYSRLAELDLPPVTQQWGPTQVFVASVVLALGTLPALRPSLRWVTYLAGLLILGWLALALWVLTAKRAEAAALIGTAIEDPGGMLASLAVALIWGMGFVHAIRYGVRRTVAGEGTRRDAVLVGSVLLIPLLACASLLSVAVIARRPRGQLTLWLASLLHQEGVTFLLFSLGGPLSLWGLGLLVGVGLSLVVLFHIVMWPVVRLVLMKTVYAAQRHELITRKGRLWSIGLAMMLCATAPRELVKLVTMITNAVR